MFYNAKNKNIKIYDYNVDYISFGKGRKNLIIIPGLGDGIKTVKGLALPYAFIYKQFCKDYRVYIFSRRNNLTKGITTEDMANDIVEAMRQLNINKADILGISQGGMIAQYIALNNPEKIHKLILAVTASRPNKKINDVIDLWIKYAENKKYKRIYIDSIEKSFSENFLERYKKYCNLFSIFSKPKGYARFIILANACINHDTYNNLSKIKLPTLVIGAENDSIVGVESSKEIADKIVDSKLYLYQDYGHAVYREAKDFNNRVLEFLKK